MGSRTILLALCIVSISTTLGGNHKGIDKHTDTDIAYTYKEPATLQDRSGLLRYTNSSCDTRYSCLNSTTARICAPTPDGRSFYEIERFTCPPSKPICDAASGTCSPNNTAPISHNFICMRDGYFPDPNNCSIYYVCQDEVAYMYTCQGYYPYYSVSSQSCISYNWYCANYYNNCTGKSGVKIGTYRYPNNIFIYCYNNAAVAVDKCIGAYQFSENTQTCFANCTHAGLFPIDGDCTQYYKCSPATHNPQDTTLIMTNMTCPEGQGFSETEYQCVDRSLAPNCKHPFIYNAITTRL